MAALRVFPGLAAAMFVSISPAAAAQLSITRDDISWYFQVLELYILPLLVISTILLLSIYGVSRLHGRYHRRRNPPLRERALEPERDREPEVGTAAFLRELRATPPIEDPETEPEVAEAARRPRSPARRDFASILAGRAAAARQTRPPVDEPEPRLERPAADLEWTRPLHDQPDAPAFPAEADSEPALGRRGGPGATPTVRAERFLRQEPGPFESSAPDWPPEPETEPEPEPEPASKPALWAELEAEPQPEPEPEPEPENETTPAIEWSLVERARREAPRPDREAVEQSPLAERSSWWSDADGRLRIEPLPSTDLDSLGEPARHSPADLERAHAMAKEITSQLDYITTILQQCVALLGDHIRARTGLDRDEVQSMRISGFEPPEDAEEALRPLGQEVVDDVVQGYDTVVAFNHIVGRLRQMAEREPLDEGWNDLIRARLSQTIYAIGKVRKTLTAAMPRNAAGGGRPAERDPESGGEGKQPGELRGVPFGRRQG